MISEENKQKIMNAVKDILEAVGEDVNRPGLAETPKRVANMYEEMFAGLDSDATQHLKLFDEKSNDEMVIVRDIPFSSMCEHHLLPFMGKAHIAYIPSDNKIIGISKLKAVHLNDSKNLCASKKDRHEKIGKGNIGMETFSKIVNNPYLRNLPFILETPQESTEGWKEEIAVLRKISENGTKN